MSTEDADDGGYEQHHQSRWGIAVFALAYVNSL